MEERRLSMSFGTAFIIGVGFALGAMLVSVVIWVIVALIVWAAGIEITLPWLGG